MDWIACVVDQLAFLWSYNSETISLATLVNLWFQLFRTIMIVDRLLSSTFEETLEFTVCSVRWWDHEWIGFSKDSRVLAESVSRSLKREKVPRP